MSFQQSPHSASNGQPFVPKEPVSATTREPVRESTRERSARCDTALKAYHREIGWRGPVAAGAAGIGAFALVVGVAAVGSLADPPVPRVDGSAAPAQLAAAGTTLVCPAPPRLPEDAADGADAQFSPVSTSAQTGARTVLLSDLAGRFPGSALAPLSQAGDDAEQLSESQPEQVQQGGPATAGEDGVPVRRGVSETVEAPGGEDGEPAVVSVEPLGGRAPVAFAVSEYSAEDGDLAGLAVSGCSDPGHRLWLAGASTTVGSTAVLVLANPSASAATVDVGLHGADGPVNAPGTAGIVLAPGETTSLVLGGLAPDEEHLAVQIKSSGGAVTAGIQQHRLDGVTPGGVDIIQPMGRPAPTAVLPGVMVPEGPVLDSSAAAGATPAVLIAAPAGGGTDEITADVTVIGPDGPVELPDGAVTTLRPGGTSQVPLTGLSSGLYSVTVEADGPVLASARGLGPGPAAPAEPDGDDDEAAAGAEAVDTAFMPSAEPLNTERVLALPPSAAVTLVLASPQGGAVELTPVLDDGTLAQPVSREIGPGAMGAVDTADLVEDGAAAGVLITTTSGSVHAGLTARSEHGISALAVPAHSDTVAGVPVRVRP